METGIEEIITVDVGKVTKGTEGTFYLGTQIGEPGWNGDKCEK